MCISGCLQKPLGHLLGEQPQVTSPPGTLNLQGLTRPLWCCWPVKFQNTTAFPGHAHKPVKRAKQHASMTCTQTCQTRQTTCFQDMHTNVLNTLNNNRCQWSYPWLHWWHCCHLLSTLWGIYSSSPALLHMIWESLWSLDCPDSNRWTPEEDVPSSNQLMGSFPQQEQCVLSKPRSRRSATAEYPFLRVSGGSVRLSARNNQE